MWAGNHSTCGPQNKTLAMGEACLQIISSDTNELVFYKKSSECYQCPFESFTMSPESSLELIADTLYATDFYFEAGGPLAPFSFCKNKVLFEDYGVYSLNVTYNNCSKILTKIQPESMTYNFLIVMGMSVGLWFLSQLFFWCYDLYKNPTAFEELQQDLGPVVNNNLISAKNYREGRMSSVDVFRGLAVTIMIFVNYGGGSYSIFKHAPWNGLTIADVVFPMFIWIMGVSIVLSVRSQLRNTTPRRRIFHKILKRTCCLLFIGVILNSGKSQSLRLPGVLQRIAITYLCVASVEIFFGKPQENERFSPWDDLKRSGPQLGIGFLTMLTQWLCLFYLPVPGCPTGYLGPGGLHLNSAFVNCTGGAAGYIDRSIFTDRYMYRNPTAKAVYQTFVPFDPEGILGTLTTITLACFGTHCGHILQCYQSSFSRLKRWVIYGLIEGLCAGIFCYFVKEGGYIPINKNLWSISYVFATGSICLLVFSAIHMLVDFWKIWKGAPFIFAGMNALALYCGHEILKSHFPWRWTPFSSTHLEILVMDVTAVSLWLFIGYFFYRNNTFYAL